MFRKQQKYQKQEKPSQTLGWWESFSSTITNIRYETTKTFSEMKQRIFEPQEDSLEKQIVIQGKKYTTRRQAKQVVKNILWFSYRKNIHIKNDKNDHRSDVGWGCLARVGQMALASALNKHFESLAQRMNYKISQGQIDSLILAFSDTGIKDEKYSLNKILQTANEMFQFKVGQWFNITSISACLHKIQNKSPMKGAQGLKVMFFDQCINVKAIFALENLKVCECNLKALVCERCHENFKRQTKFVLIKNKQDLLVTVDVDREDKRSEQSFSSHSMMKKQKNLHQARGLSMYNHNSSKKNQISNLEIFRRRVFDKDLCMFVLTRVGDPKNVQSINKAIFKLLDLSFCFGIMTGFPRQAIFVVGRQENKLIYLNPHYVQQHDARDMSRKDSYFCQQYLTCERTDLDPSMGFCFYLQNVAELEQLNYTINYIVHNYSDALSIGVDFSFSNYDCKDYIEEQNDDDNFSSLSYQSAFQM